MELTKKEALYIYNLLVETSVKLEKTNGSKVLGITLDNKKELTDKRQKLLQGLDGYENFLYYNSGSFASWPKITTT